MQLKARIANIDDTVSMSMYQGISIKAYLFFYAQNQRREVLYTDPIFKGLSSDAKVFYGMLLDRIELSMKNNWVDENNRVYIYFTIANIMEVMGWGNPLKFL